MKTNVASTPRSFLLRVAAALAIISLFALLSRAGGPRYVAGTTNFNSGTAGVPLTWAMGQITYFTDQGDLSPVLPNGAANTFVANAFNQWTSVSTAALAASSGGQLAEDVNGSNVARNSDGSLTIPADIQPSATSRPVAIVYDSDGSVTDAYLGAGAGDASQCFFNAVFGGADNLATSANFLHALVILNGQCAQQSSQLTDVEYRLVRVLGGVLGLGWSQLNSNVITGNPHPTSDDFAGFPVMHYADPFNCVPITICYPDPFQLSMDDAAAISRLYPVTAQNQSNFTGKQIFSATTARIHGSVRFTNSSGASTQPMQGVNVVARWFDPTTSLPSGKFASASVSGFLFTGNAGNPVTGFSDALGNPYSQFGATDTSLEGFFDLAGLQIPGGASSAQYQLSIEGLDPLWSAGVEPYAPYQVSPSGNFQPIVVTVSAGVDVAQDILMPRSAQPVSPWAASESWQTPAPVPPAGDWIGSLDAYGDVAYFSLPAKANRTLSFAVSALDETGLPSEQKVQPVIGIWSFADPQGTPPPAFTTSPFNGPTFATTRLDAQILTSTNFRIGIADMRGDGRPDYRYHAHVLYADSVSPPRARVSGGAITIQGTGFAPGLSVTVGGGGATPLAVSASQMILAVPAQGDGAQTIVITDPVSGAYTTMTNALTVGAAADDNLVLLQGLNPPTPVGTQAANTMVVRVVAADGATPVGGATIAWSGTNGAALSICGGATSCSTVTNDSGGSYTALTPTAAGVANVTATLAPGAYSSAKSVTGTLLGTESATDLGVTTPFFFVAQGATLSLPLTARVLSNGTPQSGVKVNFAVVSGSGSLSTSSATTNSNGYAVVTLSLTNFSAAAQVTACVAPANSPCRTLNANLVPPAQQILQPISGAGQAISLSQTFQPVIVRVVDQSTPPNPVIGAAVSFLTAVLRPVGSSPAGPPGETSTGDPAMPVILSTNQSTLATDANGLAGVLPSVGTFTGTLEVDISASAGNATLVYALEALASLTVPRGVPVYPAPQQEDVPKSVRRRFPTSGSERVLDVTHTRTEDK